MNNLNNADYLDNLLVGKKQKKTRGNNNYIIVCNYYYDCK